MPSSLSELLAQEMASLKPSKPVPFEGKRDSLAVETWLYQVDVYLNLLQVANPNMVIDDETRVAFATTLLKGNAANWWFMLVQAGQAPGQWENFKVALRGEFVPQDSERRNRDKLRNLRQTGSVAGYLTTFRNLVIGIPGMNEDEKLDRFCSGLKNEVKLEVLKANPVDLNAAAQIALNVDNAFYGAGMFSRGSQSGSAGPAPMEIGNLENGTHYRGKSFKKGKKKKTQRELDLANNACFTCHKKGCRPWKCGEGTVNVVDAVAKCDSESDSESEN